MSVGANIKRFREQADMTQNDLAQKLDVARSTVTQWENGWSSPRMGMIQKLAGVFGVTTADIVDDGSSQRSSNGIPSYAIPVKPSSTLVPLVGYTHMGDAVDEDTCERMVEVPTSVVERHPEGFCVRAEGECMDNRYPCDSVLFIDPRMEPANDRAVLAELPNYQSVVRVYMRGGSTLMLSPDSHSGEFEDIIVRADDEPVSIKGVVVWYQAESDIQ